MRDTTFTVACLSLIAVSQIAMIFISKTRWIQTLATVGFLIALIGIVRTDYYHDVHAKHLLSIPGIVLLGMSVVVMIAQVVSQIRADRQLGKGQ